MITSCLVDAEALDFPLKRYQGMSGSIAHTISHFQLVVIISDLTRTVEPQLLGY